MSNRILMNIPELVTCAGPGPKCGKDMADAGILVDAYVKIQDGLISEIGLMNDYRHEESSVEVIDCTGKAVLPGFVDSHTHFVFGGYRADEFRMRLEGADYMEIMAAGGGIASSVKATRSAQEDELFEAGQERLNAMLRMGVTTVEGKSGYGLDLETELKQLRVMHRLNAKHVMEVVPTFLGPHSIPSAYKEDPDSFIDYMTEVVLPRVAREKLAVFGDIFCEREVFSVEQSRRFLKAVKEAGLKVKIHADEIAQLGGAELAAELGAVSADHLLAASDQGIRDLAESGTVATLLPATAFSLKETYANGRKMIDAGCAVALATDFNPGSCPTHSIPLIIALSALYMGMTIEEIVNALTINGAAAVGRGDRIGSIEVGKQADLVILSKPSINYLPYHLGMNLVETVIKKGVLV